MTIPHPSGRSSQDRSPSLCSQNNDENNGSIKGDPCTEVSQIKQISNMMKPLFIFMKLFCLYPLYGRKNCPRAMHYGYLVYYTVIITVNWFNVIRYFWAYREDVFGPVLFIKIVNHVIFFQIVLGSTVFCVTSRKIEKLVKMWETIREDQDSGGVLANKILITIRVTMCLLALLLLTPLLLFINEANHMYSLKLLALPFTFNMTIAPVKQGIQIVSAIISLTTLGQWIGAVAFMVVMCIRIADDFRKIRIDMEKELNTCPQHQVLCQFDLEMYRQRHLQLCDLVTDLDSIISIYVLGTFITSIPMVCFGIYILLSRPFMMCLGSVNVVLLSVSMFLALMTITASGTILSNQARSSKDILYKVDLTNSPVSVEAATKLNLFLMKLTEGHLGISGWRIFYIDKQTSKMIVLMIVSYVVILLKFGNQEVTSSTGSKLDPLLSPNSTE